MMSRIVFVLLLTVVAVAESWSQLAYQRPPEVIENLVLAKPTPGVSISPDGATMLLLQADGYPDLDQLAKEELRIGGLRIDPANHGQSRTRPVSDVALQAVAGGDPQTIQGLPEDLRAMNVSWSPDGKFIGVVNDDLDGLSLWLIAVEENTAFKIAESLNGAMRGSPYLWVDSKSLVYKGVPANMEKPESQTELPAGPIVQESSGQNAAIRTYQDLLQNPADEDMFEYYAMSMLYKYDVESEKTNMLLEEPAMIMSMSSSPDAQYILLTTLKRPFSYLVPYYRFPMDYTVLTNDGEPVQTVAEIPLAEEIPKGFDAVREGPRSMQWRADAPATLIWAQAVDGGDPAQEVEVRDHVYALNAPFNGTPDLMARCTLRYGGVSWGDDDHMILYERMWSTRQMITSHYVPGKPDTRKVMFDRSSEDRYSDPGSFVTKANDSGYRTVLIDGDYVYMSGTGASPEGDRPFVRRMSLSTLEQQELWRSEAPYYERAVSFSHLADGKLITRRESKTEQPNYYLLDLQSGERVSLTEFEHPYPELQGVAKQEIKFKRADGIDMTGELYLPDGYDAERDGPLPTIIWAYPREYKSAAAAGQVSGSPHSFIRLYYGSPIFWITRGYAVLNNASMPIVGEEDEEPNDSFVKQLVMNAEAAIGELEQMGVCDPDRVAVGGHSYGAFMTANLLAHSDLFAAGIARSGAYNRTLTPFGFQREERTYWDDPNIYYSMSPFMHADKVNEPILLIHGEADNNSGTFPMQSKRFYSAIKGLGGTARLVMLPYESHGYRAKESILHMLWEQDQWLEKYVKNREVESSGKSD